MQFGKVGDLVSILVHIAFWAQIGVLTRIYLNKSFNDGCQGYWGVCLTSDGVQHNSLGAYFTDLPSNMLGSFIMGLLTTAATIGLDSKKPVAILPQKHTWQGHSELHVGLRTGYCGSLTTFASWELSMAQLLIGGQGPQGGQWADFLWGFVIGSQLSLSSYVFGLHFAATIDKWLLHDGDEQAKALKAQSPAAEKAKQQEEGKRLQTSQKAKLGQRNEALNNADELEEEHEMALEDGLHRNAPPGDEQPVPGQSSQPGPSADKAAESPPNTAPVSQPERKARSISKTTLCTLTLLICTTTLWCILAGLDHKAVHQARRQQWFALILAPFGAGLRWYLSRFNKKLPRPLEWYPAGTFAANMIACMIDFVLAAVAVNARLGYWPLVILPSIRVGFSGALSTVSTLVAEVHAMTRQIPERLDAYLYLLSTIATGVLLGVIFYGWGVWA
ncbi:hypothetical protein WJX73_009190 [Symbiochloris irregularis]|uniref:Fluoride ion transporter CrcB n=1 Tax=Symbiochloris irregularis TaxID=706552 RepID=A0AAW1PVD7_9CHLO